MKENANFTCGEKCVFMAIIFHKKCKRNEKEVWLKQ
jgi:hypothetical protein